MGPPGLLSALLDTINVVCKAEKCWAKQVQGRLDCQKIWSELLEGQAVETAYPRNTIGCFPNRMFTVFLALAFAALSVHSIPTPLSNWQDGTASFFGAAPVRQGCKHAHVHIAAGDLQTVWDCSEAEVQRQTIECSLYDL